MPLETSAEKPVPVRTVARLIAEWVGRLGRVWVEGQVTQISRRPGMATVFLTLRDPVAEASLRVTCSRTVCDALQPPLTDGARVVVWGKPEVHLARGTLGLTALEIRPVGVGELLARIERLKGVLAAEGLFSPERKRPLPFLPRAVGLVTGRASAAERDVVENARARWPSVRIEVREVAVQGPQAVVEVSAAVRDLDRQPDVDVIVVARGGGSVEDLLPFSDESLLRTVAACHTPVVSAIGHEQDSPLLDLVADVRASTPTHAGHLVVPSAAEERRQLHAARDRARRAVTGRIDREVAGLAQLRSRPALADPRHALAARAEDVQRMRDRVRRCVTTTLERAADDLAAARAHARALSPQATLDRGYAVLQTADGAVLRDPADTTAGQPVRARLAQGPLDLVVASPA